MRQQWELLAAAGLPSQARHSGESNAPHVTLAVRETIPDELDARLAAATRMPIGLVMGGLLVFARRRCVLARAVVPSSALLDLHARLHAVLDGDPATGPSAPHLSPGTWTPHVTLARSLAPDQVGAALALLGPLADLPGEGAAVRRWDARTRRTWVLDD